MTDTNQTEKEYAEFLSEKLRLVALALAPDNGRETTMLCAGYLRGLAGRAEQQEREINECRRMIALDTVTVNEFRALNEAVLLANKLLGDRDKSFRDMLRVCEGYLVDVSLDGSFDAGARWHGGLQDAINSIRQILDAAK